MVNPKNLITPNGFDKEFFKLLDNPKIKTHKQAFEVLNQIYKKEYNRKKYSNFNSYRVAKNRRLKNNP